MECASAGLLKHVGKAEGDIQTPGCNIHLPVALRFSFALTYMLAMAFCVPCLVAKVRKVGWMTVGT
jgi:hypothetical protein